MSLAMDRAVVAQRSKLGRSGVVIGPKRTYINREEAIVLFNKSNKEFDEQYGIVTFTVDNLTVTCWKNNDEYYTQPVA